MARHSRAISDWRALAATAALLTACSDITNPLAPRLSAAMLISLDLDAAAPPPAEETVWVVNSRPTTVVLRHGDPARSPFVTVSFPMNSLEFANGQAIGPEDSVRVTLTPVPGTYGLVLSPGDLRFTGSGPGVEFETARWADFAEGADAYGSAETYFDELEVWEEAGVDAWTPRATSTDAVTGSVATRVVAGGVYMVAAPRESI